MIVADVEYGDRTIIVIQKDNGEYDIRDSHRITQPNQDANGVIRTLANYLQNLGYLYTEELKKSKSRVNNGPW